MTIPKHLRGNKIVCVSLSLSLSLTFVSFTNPQR